MSKNKITVLLVEDEQTLAMIIKDTLEENDFIIHTASDGEEGLNLFFELHPDVLVADVMMPKWMALKWYAASAKRINKLLSYS